MERYPRANPATGFITQRFRVQSGEERKEYEKSVLRSPPPGFRNFIRWVDEDNFEFGVEAVEAPVTHVVAPLGSAPQPAAVGTGSAAATSDQLEAKTDKELQTLMGLKGLKYDKRNFIRGDAIARLRAVPVPTAGGA